MLRLNDGYEARAPPLVLLAPLARLGGGRQFLVLLRVLVVLQAALVAPRVPGAMCGIGMWVYAGRGTKTDID